MTNQFPRWQWTEYAAGDLPSDKRAEMEEHFACCEECRKAAADLNSMEVRLLGAAKSMRQALSMAYGHAEGAFPELVVRGAVGCGNPLHRVLRLKAFLSPICGNLTAERIMALSSRRVPAGSAGSDSESEWLEFLRNVSAMIEALCGWPTSRLLWEIGHCSV